MENTKNMKKLIFFINPPLIPVFYNKLFQFTSFGEVIGYFIRRLEEEEREEYVISAWNGSVPGSYLGDLITQLINILKNNSFKFRKIYFLINTSLDSVDGTYKLLKTLKMLKLDIETEIILYGNFPVMFPSKVLRWFDNYINAFVYSGDWEKVLYEYIMEGVTDGLYIKDDKDSFIKGKEGLHEYPER